MDSFLFREFQPITVLFLIYNSPINCNTRFVSQKVYVGEGSFFDSVLFLLKFTFSATKSMDSLTSKLSFQN